MTQKIKDKVTLFSVLWPVYKRLSMQFGVVKASLLKTFSNRDVAEKTGYRIYPEKKNKIKNRFSKPSSQSIFSFLSMMTEKKLIFEDNKRYLNIAIKAP